MKKKVVIKIGSNVLTRPDSTLDHTRISSLVDQVAQLHKAGTEIVLISSGAVASGRSELSLTKKLDTVSSRQLFSSIGQVKLINTYYNLFREHNITCGQVLTTKESFSSRRHYLNQKNCISVMLENGIIPIINENDTISVSELMFTDNDELSGLISTMVQADTLVILSNIDGIFNGHPSDPQSEVIREVTRKSQLNTYISSTKSQFGRGGMLTKCRISQKVADEGIEVIITNGKRENILTDLLLGKKEVISTRFIPSEKTISGVKKWIAHSDSFAKGRITLNKGAYEALTSHKVASILPIGVDRVEGEFEKDDIITILAPDGSYIGVGKTAYNSETAKKLSGLKGQKPIVHYDYLYIE